MDPPIFHVLAGSLRQGGDRAEVFFYPNQKLPEGSFWGGESIAGRILRNPLEWMRCRRTPRTGLELYMDIQRKEDRRREAADRRYKGLRRGFNARARGVGGTVTVACATVCAMVTGRMGEASANAGFSHLVTTWKSFDGRPGNLSPPSSWVERGYESTNGLRNYVSYRLLRIHGISSEFVVLLFGSGFVDSYPHVSEPPPPPNTQSPD